MEFFYSFSTSLHAWIIACVVAFPRFPLFRAVVTLSLIHIWIDLAHLIDEASEGDEQYDNEKDIRLFQNALDFSGLLVRDCMVPRVDIEAIDRTDSIRELTARFIDTHFARLPVYEENIDRIIGYVNTKSLFRQPATIDEILQQIDYVPESMPVQKLLTAFIQKRH